MQPQETSTGGSHVPEAVETNNEPEETEGPGSPEYSPSEAPPPSDANADGANADGANADGANVQDGTGTAPGTRRRRERTTQEKAFHARFMRFTRNIKSFLAVHAWYNIYDI